MLPVFTTKTLFENCDKKSVDMSKIQKLQPFK